MERRERVNDPEEVHRVAMFAVQASIWTAMPGIVKSFNATNRTVDVYMALMGQVQDEKGNWTDLQMPTLLDCPVLFQGGGNVTATFPIKANDECLVVIASRCINAWWAKGGRDNPMGILRFHDLSDGYALVGVRSLPRKLAVSTTEACLISDDGSTFVKLNPTAQTLVMTAPGGVTINTVTIDSVGNIHSTKTITGDTDVIAGGKSGKTHLHADPQGGNVGPPI